MQYIAKWDEVCTGPLSKFVYVGSEELASIEAKLRELKWKGDQTRKDIERAEGFNEPSSKVANLTSCS